MNFFETIVIGAGLTGLTIGSLLTEKNREFVILESDNKIGGRVKTEKFNDEFLDVGFHVLFENYPNFKNFHGIKKIQKQYFKSGFKIKVQDKFYKVLNPLRHPFGFLINNHFPGFSNKDRLLLLKLLLDKKILPCKNIEIINFLQNYGFSSEFIEYFFRNFFGGVFLNYNLSVPMEYFLFIFKMFAFEKVCVPKEGIQTVAQTLSKGITKNSILLNSKVKKILNNQLETDSGQKYSFKRLVCTDPSIELCMDSSINSNVFRDITYSSTHCYYYECNVENVDEYLIYLLPDTEEIVNLYFRKANSGKYIISISSMGACTDQSEKKISCEIQKIFPTITNLRLIKKFFIRKALPSNSKYFDYKDKSFLKYSKNIYFAGDFLSYPSSNGAIESGMRVVKELIKLERSA